MDQLKTKLDESIEFIANASKLLQDGKAADMENFQQRVKETCEVMSSLSLSEAEVYTEQMEQLQNALQDFEIDLRQKKADIEVEIKKLNKKQAATSAYEKANNSE